MAHPAAWEVVNHAPLDLRPLRVDQLLALLVDPDERLEAAPCEVLGEHRCVLEALRDRAPGVVRWHREGASGYLLIAGDVGVLRTATPQPLCTESSDATIVALKGAEVYAACLRDDDAAARLTCIAEGRVAGEVCGEGFVFPGECL